MSANTPVAECGRGTILCQFLPEAVAVHWQRQYVVPILPEKMIVKFYLLCFTQIRDKKTYIWFKPR